MSVEIRTLTPDDVPDWLSQRRIPFFRHEHESADYFMAGADLDRTRGAFESSRVVGTLRSFATTLSIPGEQFVPASALTNVTVSPTHRRLGVLSGMILGDLTDSAARGEALSILIASEYPIYGRFGYGPATESASYSIATEGLVVDGDATGCVEMVDRATLRELGPQVYEAFRIRQHGSILRPDWWWDRVLGIVEVPGDEPRKYFAAMYWSDSSTPEGFVLYRASMAHEDFRQIGTAHVIELCAATPEAYRALWNLVCDIDLVTTVTANERAIDESLPLMVNDARRVRRAGSYDFVWVRILDAAAALAARRYTTTGNVVIEVRDDMGFASGRYELNGGPSGATCSPTRATADLTMPVSSLGAMYLGGTRATRLHAAHRIEENRPGAVAEADLMFATLRAPWCTTWF